MMNGAVAHVCASLKAPLPRQIDSTYGEPVGNRDAVLFEIYERFKMLTLWRDLFRKSADLCRYFGQSYGKL